MIWMWIAFIAVVGLLLALDLGVIHRKAHAVGTREALGWSAVWVGLALAFAGFVYFGYEHHLLGLGTAIDRVDGLANTGRSAATKFLTGYLVEKSLSVDNLFVIAVLFASLKTPAASQHRVLFWGIVGAFVFRGAMIGAGYELILRYHWVLYAFGGLLLVLAIKMLFLSSHAPAGEHRLVRFARRWLPLSERYHGEHFIARENGRLIFTPLALALGAVESTDVVLAVDSIPAIFAVTADPFLVFTSNVFAVLGLRSLYFALAGMIGRFEYLKYSLALLLAVIGAKMLGANWIKTHLGPSSNVTLLGLILVILLAGVVASVVADRRRRRNGGIAANAALDGSSLPAAPSPADLAIARN